MCVRRLSVLDYQKLNNTEPWEEERTRIFCKFISPEAFRKLFCITFLYRYTTQVYYCVFAARGKQFRQTFGGGERTQTSEHGNYKKYPQEAQFRQIFAKRQQHKVYPGPPQGQGTRKITTPTTYQHRDRRTTAEGQFTRRAQSDLGAGWAQVWCTRVKISPNGQFRGRTRNSHFCTLPLFLCVCWRTSLGEAETWSATEQDRAPPHLPSPLPSSHMASTGNSTFYVCLFFPCFCVVRFYHVSPLWSFFFGGLVGLGIPCVCNWFTDGH